MRNSSHIWIDVPLELLSKTSLQLFYDTKIWIFQKKMLWRNSNNAKFSNVIYRKKKAPGIKPQIRERISFREILTHFIYGPVNPFLGNLSSPPSHLNRCSSLNIATSSLKPLNLLDFTPNSINKFNSVQWSDILSHFVMRRRRWKDKCH